jgi:hypothetical protein
MEILGTPNPLIWFIHIWKISRKHLLLHLFKFQQNPVKTIHSAQISEPSCWVKTGTDWTILSTWSLMTGKNNWGGESHMFIPFCIVFQLKEKELWVILELTFSSATHHLVWISALSSLKWRPSAALRSCVLFRKTASLGILPRGRTVWGEAREFCGW